MFCESLRQFLSTLEGSTKGWNGPHGPIRSIAFTTGQIRIGGESVFSSLQLFIRPSLHIMQAERQMLEIC